MFDMKVIKFLNVDPVLITFSESFAYIRVSKENGWCVS